MFNSSLEQRPNHIYYNFTFTNLNKDVAVPANIKDTRSEPIVNNPNNWECAIDRFQIPLNNYPLFYWPTTFSSNTYSPDDTIWSITIEKNDGTTFAQEFLKYSDIQIISTVYGNNFGVWNPTDYMTSINYAIKRACTTLGVANMPYIYFDVDTGLTNVVFPYSSFDPTAGTHYRLYMNYNLFKQFDNLIFNYNDAGLNGRIYHIKANIFNNQNVISSITFPNNPTGMGTNGATGAISYAQFSNIGQMCDLRKIIFSTSFLPTRSELLPNEINNINNSVSQNSQPILQDFEVILEGNDGRYTRSIQSYYNKGEYRIIDLADTRPITNINLFISTFDKYGKLRPLMLNYGDFVSMKLMFRRK